MKKTLLAKTVVCGMELEYFLTVSYGVKVVKDKAECSRCVDISDNIGEVEQFIEKLCVNTVTPVHLPDVVSDWQVEKDKVA